MNIKLLFIFLFVVTGIKAQTVILKNRNWSLYSDSVTVKNIDPSDVYLALFAKNVIDNPFFRDNEKKLQWIGNKDWTFITEFDLPKSFREKDRVDMVFEGLDTYATVYFNGVLILQADNMFRKWVADVKKVVKKHNHLKVIFKSPFKIIKAARKTGKWKLPYDYGYVRKAPYHFGWDWSPTYITCGIWRPAHIRAWSDAEIKDIFINQKKVAAENAKVEVQIILDATKHEKGKLLLFRDSVLVDKQPINIVLGINKFSISNNIASPKLWWPNGMGAPNMIEYKVQLRVENRLVDSKIVKTGLRTIVVVQKPDSVGKSFYFKVNGQPVFIKGANYIPPDNFLPRVSDDRYRKIVADAKNANMNMLRVWGGGTYEKETFYRFCDENGIMVWQDFMFAGNMLPGDSAFVENVKQEAIENVIRLRNHPSIALWCGNNEIDEAWHNWGWQKQYHYSKYDSAKLWNAYLNIFEDVLPQIVNRYAPGVFYWPSSPSVGWGHPQAFTQGDVHYWEVWWGKAPFMNFEKKVGRFMSEYGFQGMPEIETIDAFTLPEDRYLGSKVLNAHQKHPFGWEAIKEYMKRNFLVPENLEEYDYVSQLLQAKGIGMAIEAHRRAKPYCMGTLYWQINDCWPVVSWSSVDYYGRWKALHYKVKELYRREMISFDKNSDSLRIWIVTDDVKPKKCYLQWWLLRFDGNIVKEQDTAVELKVNSSQAYETILLRKLENSDTASVVLHAILLSHDSLVLAENNFYFTKPKNLNLKKPNILIKMKKSKQGYLIRLQTNYLAKGVYLSTSVKGFFDDNYFDLIPGIEKQLFFKTNTILNNNDLNIISLYDIGK